MSNPAIYFKFNLDLFFLNLFKKAKKNLDRHVLLYVEINKKLDQFLGRFLVNLEEN